MISKYQKTHASLTEQIQILQSRGLKIDDRAQAEHCLLSIGYYRLSSYCYRFELPPTCGLRSHKFIPGTTLDDVLRVYVFDQRLRSLMLEALARFEIFARSAWAHELSAIYGPHPHMNAENFADHDEYLESIHKLEEATSRAYGNTVEVRHYLDSYDDPALPPIWIAVSVMSFGELFKWIKNTKNSSVKKSLVITCGMPNVKVFEGVARSLTTVRNICAHHGRLWDRHLATVMPYIQKGLKVPMEKRGNAIDPRMFNVIVILGHMMVSMNADSTWPNRVAKLVSTLGRRGQRIMGFPDNWERNKFWKL